MIKIIQSNYHHIYIVEKRKNIIQRIIRNFCGRQPLLTIRCVHFDLTSIQPLYEVSSESYSSIGKKHSLGGNDFSYSGIARFYEFRVKKGMLTIEDVIDKMYDIVYYRSPKKILKKHCHIYYGSNKLSRNESISVLFRDFSKNVKFCYEPERF